MADDWLNGEFVDETKSSLPLRDTGLLHAAGVFTTMRADGGVVFRLDRHLKRIRQSCDALFIPLQYTDQALTEAVDQLLRRRNLLDARMRLTITRGSARHDPIHGARLEPNVFITATNLDPYPNDYYQRGFTVITLDDQKLNPYDIQAGHKTLNYFTRLASLRAANNRQAGEALWFNVHNYLQSGSISNVFVVEAGRLLTPPTQADLQLPSISSSTPYPRSNVLPGVTRQTVIELAESAGIHVDIRALTINDLLEADEIFLTNSIMRVMPVCRVERKAVANEKPGEITKKLMEAYRKLAAAR